jgi:hypothetical protein
MEYRVPERVRGFVLGTFGQASEPSHVVVVNLDYKAEATTAVVGPGRLELFDATTVAWQPADGAQAQLKLPPGGGRLLRLGR